MLKMYQFESSKLVAADNALAPVLVFINPTAEEVHYLVDECKIDEHTLSSSLDPDELSRLEFEPEHVAMILKRPKNYSDQEHFLFKIGSTGLFWFEDRLIIVMEDDVPLFDGKQFQRVNSLSDLVLKILYRSISHFLAHLKVINQISDELEHKVNSSMENKFLLDMFALEKSLVYYLNAINANSVLIDRIRQNKNKIGFSADETEVLDDIAIENNQCYRLAEIYSNILASLMDARVSIVGNNLNILMKTLNVITIGIMVPTFVVSAFSMNVDIPFEHSPHAFWIIISFAAISVMAFMSIWQVKKR